MDMDMFQKDVVVWATDCFGRDVLIDREERSFRFCEESIELLQACGVSKGDVLKLVDYVYDRPVGDVGQEVGGVMVTLALLCHAAGISLDLASINELRRIELIKDKIRAKWLSKPKDIRGPIPGLSPDEKPIGCSGVSCVPECKFPDAHCARIRD